MIHHEEIGQIEHMLQIVIDTKIPQQGRAILDRPEIDNIGLSLEQLLLKSYVK